MWPYHSSHILNMVNESNNSKDIISDMCSIHSLFDQNMVVTSNEMENNNIKDLAYNTSPGLWKM